MKFGLGTNLSKTNISPLSKFENDIPFLTLSNMDPFRESIPVAHLTNDPLLGIIRLVSLQPKNKHFLTSDTHSCMCVSVGKKCYFFVKFCKSTK